MMASLYFIENKKKEALLKMTPLPGNMVKYPVKYVVKSVFVIVTLFGIVMMASLYFMETEKKEALLKKSPLPGHKGVETGGDPKEQPQAKTRRDFVKKVLFYSLSFFIDQVIDQSGNVPR